MEEIRVNKILDYLKMIALLNLILMLIIMVLEIISIFNDTPLLFFMSEGDSAGISEFSGNWFDHLLKALIVFTLAIIFGFSYRKIGSKTKDENRKALSFIIGGSIILVGISVLYWLVYISGFIQISVFGEFQEWVWYEPIRLEMFVFIWNIPVIKLWTNKQKMSNFIESQSQK